MGSLAVTPTGSKIARFGTTGIGNTLSFSTSVNSYQSANWWTREEARLYTNWAESYQKYNDIAPKPYFDYFYTGQDIRVKIDGLDDNEHLPVYSFGYQIQQQKQPLYGYASYVYDAVLRGTRVVAGAFSLVVTEPFLLTTQIAKSADRRASTNQSYAAYSLRNFDGDQENINRYWRRNYDSGLDSGDKHLFSIHPPFNILIKYGIQETSLVGDNPNLRVNEVKEKFNENSAIWNNTNERLVENNTARKTHILLENIELTSKAIEYDPSGDPILETYTFLARDERLVDDSSTMDVSRTLPRTSGVGGGGSVVF